MARTESAPRSGSMLGTALQIVTLCLLLAILTAVVLVLFSVVSLANVPNQVAGGVSSQLGSAATGVQQALQNATDPNHPPIGLSYDTQFSALDTWHVGDGLPGGTGYVLTVQSIQRRDNASSAQTGVYATIHAELRQPHETRLLGQVVRSDSDPHDYVVYTGETFRIGHQVFRVNWISQDQNAIAAGVVRNPDSVTQQLKFDYP
jgi:hypothetical protein